MRTRNRAGWDAASKRTGVWCRCARLEESAASRLAGTHGSENSIDRAADVIHHGGLVAFPTETVYGLGANALDAAAVERIYTVKGRPASSPLIVHVANIEMAKSLVAEWPVAAQALAQRFWPGPLTLVLKKSRIVPDIVTAGLDSVAVRVPAHPLALTLIQRADIPIAAPSANRFTQLSPTTAAHVRASLGNHVDLILDGGPTQIGIESTVLSLTAATPVILRPGMITQIEIESVIGAVALNKEAQEPGCASESPGQHPRHYAPRTPFYLLENDETIPDGRGRVITLPNEPSRCAAVLYAELHQADQEGWDWIAVEKPPETPEWAAILDRLKRAANRK